MVFANIVVNLFLESLLNMTNVQHGFFKCNIFRIRIQNNIQDVVILAYIPLLSRRGASPLSLEMS